MSLVSQLFRGDSQLDAAAVSDAAHILPGSQGSHVTKIQQALSQVDGANIKADGAFGPKTAAAVRVFKTKRQILNYQGQIDEIVGKKTIAALDAELVKKPGGGGAISKPGALPGVPGANGASGGKLGVTGPSDGGSGAGGLLLNVRPLLTIVPLNKKPLTLIETFDTRTFTKEKNDLNASNPPIPALTFLESAAVLAFLGREKETLQAFMSAELQFFAGPIGLECFNRFVNNPKAGDPSVFPTTSNLSAKVEGLDVFKEASAAVTAEFDAAVKKQAATGVLDVNLLEANTDSKGKFGRPQKTNPNGIKTSVDLEISKLEVALQAVIGGSFQGGKVSLLNFEANPVTMTYSATLRYTMIDHFGVDNGDVLPPPPHGSPGQISFWVLQHHHHPGHNPYITTVEIDRLVNGRLV